MASRAILPPFIVPFGRQSLLPVFPAGVPVGLACVGRRSRGATCSDSDSLRAPRGNAPPRWWSSSLAAPGHGGRGPVELGWLRPRLCGTGSGSDGSNRRRALRFAWVRGGTNLGRQRPMYATHDSCFKAEHPSSRLHSAPLPTRTGLQDSRHGAASASSPRRRAFLPGHLGSSVPLMLRHRAGFRRSTCTPERSARSCSRACPETARSVRRPARRRVTWATRARVETRWSRRPPPVSRELDRASVRPKHLPLSTSFHPPTTRRWLLSTPASGRVSSTSSRASAVSTDPGHIHVPPSRAFGRNAANDDLTPAATPASRRDELDTCANGETTLASTPSPDRSPARIYAEALPRPFDRPSSRTRSTRLDALVADP